MKKFVFLSYGFEKPTPEIMGAWGKWFESIADKIVEKGGHFSGGREISHSGTKDLPMGMESITGYTVIQADSLDDAEKIARGNPFIASISPNPPKDTDGRREDSGRGWVRELQGRWPGVLG